LKRHYRIQEYRSEVAFVGSDYPADRIDVAA
jgi:hypothetical protein